MPAPGSATTWRPTTTRVSNARQVAGGAGDILGDYPQAVGPAADALYATATTISPEARDWVRNFLTTQHNVRF